MDLLGSDVTNLSDDSADVILKTRSIKKGLKLTQESSVSHTHSLRQHPSLTVPLSNTLPLPSFVVCSNYISDAHQRLLSYIIAIFANVTQTEKFQASFS